MSEIAIDKVEIAVAGLQVEPEPHRELLSLPMWRGMSDAQIERVHDHAQLALVAGVITFVLAGGARQRADIAAMHTRAQAAQLARCSSSTGVEAPGSAPMSSRASSQVTAGSPWRRRRGKVSGRK